MKLYSTYRFLRDKTFQTCNLQTAIYNNNNKKKNL